MPAELPICLRNTFPCHVKNKGALFHNPISLDGRNPNYLYPAVPNNDGYHDREDMFDSPSLVNLSAGSRFIDPSLNCQEVEFPPEYYIRGLSETLLPIGGFIIRRWNQRSSFGNTNIKFGTIHYDLCINARLEETPNEKLVIPALKPSPKPLFEQSTGQFIEYSDFKYPDSTSDLSTDECIEPEVIPVTCKVDDQGLFWEINNSTLLSIVPDEEEVEKIIPEERVLGNGMGTSGKWIYTDPYYYLIDLISGIYEIVIPEGSSHFEIPDPYCVILGLKLKVLSHTVVDSAITEMLEKGRLSEREIRKYVDPYIKIVEYPI